MVPTRPQPGLELDRALTRQLAARTNRFLGVYADVTTPGLLRVGDDVVVRAAEPLLHDSIRNQTIAKLNSLRGHLGAPGAAARVAALALSMTP